MADATTDIQPDNDEVKERSSAAAEEFDARRIRRALGFLVMRQHPTPATPGPSLL